MYTYSLYVVKHVFGKSVFLNLSGGIIVLLISVLCVVLKLYYKEKKYPFCSN